MTLTSATTLTPSLTRRTLHLASLRLLASTLLAVTLLLLNGCGRDHGATVSGTVTLDGAPLQAGKITFHPVGDGPIAYGQINQKGEFKLSTGQAKTLYTGQYQVTVSLIKITIGGNNDEEAAPEYLTPKRYADKSTSGLEFTVRSGDNKFNIPLTSEE